SLLALVVPAMLCFGFSRRPVRFGLGIAAILLAGTLSTGEQGRVVATRRSFFGVNRVTLDARRGLHLLIHGSTLHGAQSVEPARCREPLGYYHPSGPIGQVLEALGDPPSVALVGLGAGALACQARPRARGRRSGARCGPRRAHPGRRRDPGRARAGEARVALGGHGAPPGRPRQPGGRRALDAAPGARGRAGVDRRFLERARRAALALISAEARRACRGTPAPPGSRPGASPVPRRSCYAALALGCRALVDRRPPSSRSCTAPS